MWLSDRYLFQGYEIESIAKIQLFQKQSAIVISIEKIYNERFAGSLWPASSSSKQPVDFSPGIDQIEE